MGVLKYSLWRDPVFHWLPKEGGAYLEKEKPGWMDEVPSPRGTRKWTVQRVYQINWSRA